MNHKVRKSIHSSIKAVMGDDKVEKKLKIAHNKQKLYICTLRLTVSLPNYRGNVKLSARKYGRRRRERN